MNEKKVSCTYRKKQFFTLLILLTFFTVAACGQGMETDNANGRSSGSTGNTVEGNSTNLSEPVTDVNLPDVREELWKKVGLNGPTGKWFMHDGEGIFGYTLPHGTKRAGDEISIGLFSHKKDGDILERTVRIQLIEMTAELEKIEVTLEKECDVDKIKGNDLLFSIHLPEKENTHYLLNMEIVDAGREVEDSMISLIKVPAYELNADLSTSKSNDNELTIIVENEGPTDLFFGKYYKLEKQVNGVWEGVILQDAFEDIGIILPAEQTYEDKINISTLSKGTYRLSKDVGAEGLDLIETLSTTFHME